MTPTQTYGGDNLFSKESVQRCFGVHTRDVRKTFKDMAALSTVHQGCFFESSYSKELVYNGIIIYKIAGAIRLPTVGIIKGLATTSDTPN